MKDKDDAAEKNDFISQQVMNHVLNDLCWLKSTLIEILIFHLHGVVESIVDS